jgi:Abi-like protein.
MFSGANDFELYGAYCWNEALSATLFRLIAITEVVMRNRFHEALSRHLYNQNSVGYRDSNDWYNHVDLPHKSMQKIKNETHYRHRRSRQLLPKVPAPTANDVVSRMTFGFWPKLLEGSMPWGQLLDHVLPGHRNANSGYWQVLARRDALYARLDMLNKIRNRVAHFEPVWKQGDLYEERRRRQGSPALSVEFQKPTTPEDAIERIKLIHDRTVELLKWLSPSRCRDYKESYVEKHFNWMCSVDGLNAYMQFKPRVILPLSRFKRDLNGLIRREQMVTVIRRQDQVGTYYPIRR